MSHEEQEEQARRARTEELRQEIAKGRQSDAVPEHPEILPGESPNQYVERRMRELDNNRVERKPPQPPPGIN